MEVKDSIHGIMAHGKCVARWDCRNLDDCDVHDCFTTTIANFFDFSPLGEEILNILIGDVACRIANEYENGADGARRVIFRDRGSVFLFSWQRIMNVDLHQFA